MKRHHFLTLLLASFFVLITFHGSDVSAAISGDEVCGSVGDKCGADDLKKIFQGIFSTIIAIGTPLLVVFVIYRFVMAWYALNQGNANAYKEATQKAGQAILGFLVIVALFGGLFLGMLRFFGVNEPMLKLLDDITEVVVPRAYAAPVPKNACPTKPQGLPCLTDSDKTGFCTGPSQCSELNPASVLVPKGNCGGRYGTGVSCLTDNGEQGACYTSYCVKLLPELAPVAQPQTPQAPTETPPPAQAPANTATTLPNPVGVTSLYDFILSALALVMRFFIYPALIGMWVWSGFNYVLAQGAPEKLAKNHKLLMWAFISTLIVFVTQGFLTALRNSVQKVLPATSQVINVERISLLKEK